MLRLCRKDFLAARWLWLGIGLTLFLYGLQPVWPPVAILLLGPAAALAALIVILGLEDKGKTEILYASLPLGRARIVRARYLLAGLLTAAAAGLVFGALALIFRFWRIGGQRSAAGALLIPEALVLFPAALLLLFSYYLPFVFGLGFGRGSGFAAGILAAAAALWAALAPGAVGRWFARRAPGGGLVPDPVGSVLRAAAGIRESWGTPAFLAAAAALTALILWLSLRLSTALYKRRDL